MTWLLTPTHEGGAGARADHPMRGLAVTFDDGSRDWIHGGVTALWHAAASASGGGGEGTGLGGANAGGNADAVRCLIQVGGANPDTTVPGGWSALFVASQHGHVRVVKELVKHGAGVNLARDDGATALFTARVHGHTEVADFIERAGAHFVPPQEGDGADFTNPHRE